MDPEYLKKLAIEALAVADDQIAAARVTILKIHKSGRVTRTEIDPEADRTEAARNFEIPK